MAEFPGYGDRANFTEWYTESWSPIYKWSNIIWGVLNSMSTIISIVGIYKIFKTMKQLKRNNSNLNTN
jgi:hypothetical protein